MTLSHYAWCVYLFSGHPLYEKLAHLPNNLAGAGNPLYISTDNVNLTKPPTERGC
ncbi:hypothetical protein EFER_1610 [Escherichia fergusonii ATCC 35469]|uniref:Uncharacterized protein n=1 Tax=Escherichia fergusonii (strain ATCC 35469 / DSM 13698 / CCUG 18766 / IAM 14443 / JCM 21226 / LMG 7866 / NBRC 102419 / NCTC 12128 / CDC 0568-73) TaxID=585054 RepID=B7LRI4_ESCF3|nr:hypothetical protein EFER_1610 [Escherichia fergusonii ATCC 35469]